MYLFFVVLLYVYIHIVLLLMLSIYIYSNLKYILIHMHVLPIATTTSKMYTDATDYTATVSQYFTIPELFAIKQFMHKKDVKRLLQMAHKRFEQTGLSQSNHSEKWGKYCSVCHANEELSPKIAA